MNHKSLSEVNSSISVKQSGKFRKLLAYFGPAYLVSVGYMDPGNWATDIAGGSKFGYALIWVLLLSNISAILLQTLSARLGLVRKMDLAQASRMMYPVFTNRCLFVFAQIAIIAMDLAEVIGVAIGLNLLFGLPLAWGVIVTVFDSILLLALLHRGIRLMESFIISMLFVIGVSFIAQMFIVEPEAMEIMKGFTPQMLSGESLYLAIGIIGATVMPHNLYLHSALVQTRKISENSKSIREAIRVNFFDTTLALNLAFFVNAAILITAAAAFFTNGFNEVAEIHDAHKLLGDIFGPAAPTLFAIALIAAGQSSTITGTLAGQIVMEGHINLRITPWVRRLITRLCAIAPALFTVLFTEEGSLGKLLVFSQVILSLQLGFAIIPLVFLASDKNKMGEFGIKPFTKVLAWIIVTVIIYLNIQFVLEELSGWYRAYGLTWWYLLIVIPTVVFLAGVMIYIFLRPLKEKLFVTDFGTSPEEKSRMANENFVSHIQALHRNLSGNRSDKDLLGDYESPPVYGHIAVAVDFSEKDGKAIEQALKIGGKGAGYTLLHVSEDAASWYSGGGSKRENIKTPESQVDLKMLEGYIQPMTQAGFRVDCQVGYGGSVKELSRLINRHPEFDLVILCAHKHKGLKNIFYGSTIGKLRRNVKVPLLII